ncbi:MAG TPA: glycoside hydrolase family 15 protein, partial [Chthoniobacteraceae bacterium]
MRIEDYGLIGDTQTAALVSRAGSIDWLCLPRFDSGACFCALLGTEQNGRWIIAPTDQVTSTRRRYRPGSLVLETELETESGAVVLTDCMPPRERNPDLVRLVSGRRGRVKLRMELVIRFDYGSVVPWVRTVDGHLQAVAGPHALDIWSEVPTHGEDLKTVAEFEVTEGQSVAFALRWHPSHEAGEDCFDIREEIEKTDRWWSSWSEKANTSGEWDEAVRRSLITLKALTFEPTGGIIAAPTTSLPELPGGVRNWDYRYCWLRDATFSLHAFLLAGYRDEACAWREWLLRAVAGDPAKLQIMYGPAGERRLEEYELPWLAGCENSLPVRVGNAAHAQFQLDVYGEVIASMHRARLEGIDHDQPSWNLQRAILEFLETAWREPDDGIWEVRGPRRHFTHSKLMAWVAFDRAVQAVERFGMEGPLDRWKAQRQKLREEICAKGYNAKIGSFTQDYGSDRLDASLLMIPLSGFLPPEDERVRGTVRAIERDLLEDGFVLRYRRDRETSPRVDGLPPGEGAFLPCTFWLADNYAISGRTKEARALFERLLSIRNDLGLLAEEYDPRTRRQLGNFPQAFTHVGLVNTAHHLSTGAPLAHRQGHVDKPHNDKSSNRAPAPR